MTSSWFFLSTLNYDARSTTHQLYLYLYLYRYECTCEIINNCFASFPIAVKFSLLHLHQPERKPNRPSQVPLSSVPFNLSVSVSHILWLQLNSIRQRLTCLFAYILSSLIFFFLLKIIVISKTSPERTTKTGR